MKKIYLLLILLVLPISTFAIADNNTRLILNEIKQLRADMNLRFEQVDKRFEQVDKRFEQVDKRFEQNDRRLNFLEKLIYFLMLIVFASPFLAIYLKNKSEGKLQAVIFALKEASQEDKRLSKALKIAGLD